MKTTLRTRTVAGLVAGLAVASGGQRHAILNGIAENLERMTPDELREAARRLAGRPARDGRPSLLVDPIEAMQAVASVIYWRAMIVECRRNPAALAFMRRHHPKIGRDLVPPAGTKPSAWAEELTSRYRDAKLKTIERQVRWARRHAREFVDDQRRVIAEGMSRPWEGSKTPRVSASRK